MTENTLINIAILGISCLLLWYLYFVLFKDYIVDSYRQEVFILRDDLFDYAASGKIDFNHPAYCVLRRTMNGYIRFSHRISLLDALVLGVTVKTFNRTMVPSYSSVFENQFESSLKTLDESVASKLRSYNRKSKLLLARYILASSPVLGVFLTIFLIVLIFPLTFFFSKVQETARRLALIQIKNIQSEAFSIGKL